MKHPRSLTCLVLVFAPACGGDGGDGDDSCGTDNVPTVLQLKDVSPAPGETVAGEITHKFTIVDVPITSMNPGTFDKIIFIEGPEHTAGTRAPAEPMVTATLVGSELRYDVAPLLWEEGGHVVVRSSLEYKGADGCTYVLPDPLFEYDVIGPPD